MEVLDKKLKVGVLGGTFDPVHEGHLAVAHHVLDKCHLDAVLFIPAPSPPHKGRILTPFVHRVAMLEAALHDEPALMVSILEAERQRPSFTVETLEELHRRWEGREFYLIVGADMFIEIELWYRFADLFHLAHLIVVARPGYEFAAVADEVARLPGPFNFDAGRQMWRRNDGFKIMYLADLALPVSSSRIRELLAHEEAVDDLLPTPVLDYIRKNQLYGTDLH